MNILIPDKWLREFLATSATPEKIAECLSLCGPSVEKVHKEAKNTVYSIEVTTNRVDTASVYGIAREGAAILPRFGIRAKLRGLKVKSQQDFATNVDYLDVKVDYKLCPRFTAVLIKNVKIKNSPSWMQEKLQLVGARPINNIVDISNYLMFELGQPLHTFDYDKISGHKLILRKSKEGEVITTLDNKTHTLSGGDIVIEDGEGRLIDLAGIMGGKDSCVDESTKNVLLFVQTYNPKNIRQTVMSLGHRTYAASLFEKGLDPENVEIVARRAIDLFVKLCHGKPEREILDLYPTPYKTKAVETTHAYLETRLGIEIPKSEITKILSPLGFGVSWKQDRLAVVVPSWRGEDISYPHDIIEEIARLYGYHNLPSLLMSGKLPEPLFDSPFEFESKLKGILKGLGGVEVYTLSLVDKNDVSAGSLRLKNPLGSDFEYLRTSLAPSLIKALLANKSEKEPFHLFEMSNVYLPKKDDLPEEKMMLAGIFSNYSYRSAKGIIESLLEELRIDVRVKVQDHFGILKEGFPYYEFDVEALEQAAGGLVYKPIPKYPAQIEDISLILPPRTLIGNVIEQIKAVDTQIASVQLLGVYKDSITVRIAYQSQEKTLTDKEVEKIRNKIIGEVKRKLGLSVKQ